MQPAGGLPRKVSASLPPKVGTAATMAMRPRATMEYETWEAKDMIVDVPVGQQAHRHACNNERICLWQFDE